MPFVRNIVLITVVTVSYCSYYYQTNAQKVVNKREASLSHPNEGDVCDEVNGVEWRCQSIIKCSRTFIMSLKTTKPKMCRNNGVNSIFCCNSANSMPAGNVAPPTTPWLISTESSATQPKRPKPIPTLLASTTKNTRRTIASTVTTQPTLNLELSDKEISRLRISERKCMEYSKAVFQTPQVMSLAIDIIDEEEEEEIKPEDTCARKQIPLIVGGEIVIPKEFPHQALLGYTRGESPEVKWKCGGILISEYYILTAGHCVDNADGAPTVALLGEVNYVSGGPMSNRKLVGIENAIVHNDYVKNKPPNDIALLLTNKKIDFNAFIRPACIQTSPQVFPLSSPEKAALATGWGLTGNGGSLSKDLLKVRLNVIDRDTCDKFYNKLQTGEHFIDDERMICAGDFNRSRDTCSGDSGGPLQVTLENPYCMYSVVGVTSFGLRDQCGNRKPSVFTRVSFYQDWIESIVWPDQ